MSNLQKSLLSNHSKMNHKVFFSFLIFSALLLSACSTPDSNSDLLSIGVEAPQQGSVDSLQNEDNEEVEPYQLRSRWEVRPVDDYGFTEQDLIQVDPETGEEAVLIENIFEKYQQNFNMVRGAIDGSNFLVFLSVIPETDSPPSGLFTLNLDTLELNPLSVDAVKHDVFGYAISPDGKYMVWAPSYFIDAYRPTRKLYLVDLMDDTYSVLLELPETEDLNTINGFAGRGFELEWLDDETVKYAVFSPEKNGLDDVLLEYREVTLN